MGIGCGCRAGRMRVVEDLEATGLFDEMRGNVGGRYAAGLGDLLFRPVPVRANDIDMFDQLVLIRKCN